MALHVPMYIAGVPASMYTHARINQLPCTTSICTGVAMNSGHGDWKNVHPSSGLVQWCSKHVDRGL